MASRLLTAVATLLAALACAIVAAAPAQAAGCAGAKAKPRAGQEGKARKATLCLINRERAKRGLGRLSTDARLRKAATRHSRDMVRRRYFDHTAPSGATMVTRATRANYLRSDRAWSLAENIAQGSGRAATPASIVRQWMRSPPHRANILMSGMRDAGLGVAARATTGRRGATYTVNFGRVG